MSRAQEWIRGGTVTEEMQLIARLRVALNEETAVRSRLAELGYDDSSKIVALMEEYIDKYGGKK